jgi:hypothetical protein
MRANPTQFRTSKQRNGADAAVGKGVVVYTNQSWRKDDGLQGRGICKGGGFNQTQFRGRGEFNVGMIAVTRRCNSVVRY